MRAIVNSIFNCFVSAALALAILALIELTDIFCFVRPVFFDAKEILLFLYIFAGFYCMAVFLLAPVEGIIISLGNSLASVTTSSSRGRMIRASIYTLFLLPLIVYFSTRILTGKGIFIKLSLIGNKYNLPFNLATILTCTLIIFLAVLTYLIINALVKQNQSLLEGKFTRSRISYSIIIIAVSILALYWANSRLYVRLYEYVHSIATLLLILLGQLLAYSLAAFRNPHRYTSSKPAYKLKIVPLVVLIGLVFLPDSFFFAKSQNIKLISLQKTSIERKIAIHLDKIIHAVSSMFNSPYSILRYSKDMVFVDLDEILGSGKSAYPISKHFRENHLFENPDDLNVLYIVIDSLRADHLGCYGYNRDTSPVIDSIADEGILFLNNYAQGNHTLSAMGSVFTSRYYYSLERNPAKNDIFRAFTNLLRKNNFTSYVSYVVGKNLINNPVYFPLNRIIQSFDRNVDFSRKKMAGIFKEYSEKERERFFIWLHLRGPHYPYRLHPEYNFGPTPIDLYDSEVKYWDHIVGELIDDLKKANLMKKTILIINSDHGEELKDHGGMAHASTCYNEQLHVPLIIKIPSIPPGKISAITGNIDIVPTLLDILNISPGISMHGSSLVPLILNKSSEPATIFAEAFYSKMVINRDWKLIFNFSSGTMELYHLSTDPKEITNLADKNRPRALELKKELALHTMAEYQINKDKNLLDKLLSFDRDSVIDYLINLLNSKNRSKQILALDFISNFSDKRFLQPLLSMTKQNNKIILSKVIPLLANYKSPKATSALKQLLSFPDAEIKKESIRALVNLNDPGITSELNSLLQSKEYAAIIQAAEYVLLAESYKQKGNIPAAIKYCSKAMKLDGESPQLKEVWDNLRDAQFVSQSVPGVMLAGESYKVAITMKNTGSTNWTYDDIYRLISQNPLNNFTWGHSRICLKSGDLIAPGESATFFITLLAPSEPGAYNFQWRMIQESVEVFGEHTPNVLVQVISK